MERPPLSQRQSPPSLPGETFPGRRPPPVGDRWRWERPWRDPPLKERPVPRGPPPARPSPAAARLLRKSPMSASRRRAAAGEVFLGEVCKSKSIPPSNAICPAYQKTGQPPLVVRFLMIWVYSYVTYQLLPLLFTGYWPPTARRSAVHYTLLIVYPTSKKLFLESYRPVAPIRKS